METVLFILGFISGIIIKEYLGERKPKKKLTEKEIKINNEKQEKELELIQNMNNLLSYTGDKQ